MGYGICDVNYVTPWMDVGYYIHGYQVKWQPNGNRSTYNVNTDLLED